MLQIKPGEYLPIEVQLKDPTDSGTRYVRAYIRKMRGSSDTLLDTVDLTDNGSQRFTYSYQVPDDSDAYFLCITIKVFDDSGYTTESKRYAREHFTYLVAERWGLYYGHGGGVEVDYDKIRKMIREEVGKTPKGEKINLSPLLDALMDVNKSIKAIKFPEPPVIPKPEKVDFKPVIKAVEKVQDEVRAIKMPQTDLGPILKGIETAFTAILKQFTNISKEDKKELAEKFQALKDEFKSVTFVKMREEKPPPLKKRKIFTS